MHLLSVQSASPYEYIQQHTKAANRGRPVLCFEYRQISASIFKPSFDSLLSVYYSVTCQFPPCSPQVNRTIVGAQAVEWP